MSSEQTIEKKNPAIGAGYSQTNLAYLQQDEIPEAPPFRRVDTEIEKTPHYASYPILGKCEEGNWISWIQLADGLYEQVNRQVDEDYDTFVQKRRQVLIDNLTNLQNKSMEGAMPPIKRTEEYPGYSCISEQALAVETMPGVTVTKAKEEKETPK